ncbi:benzoate 4-monooxygenase cytochrome P450 [Penicillium riverlandense]|uniref:benzoate 4-monooxygenase cytochrome P450 n=1 Tax=Penicillium riverlandense TaxID=1903569 RepID=UPI00254970BD|nr:benzoate 4-monooxygenase cytochrome P450 [Penicillium riverlandense]KAJ5815706.1 benzoate 4-monooxygenase cytochrome P450 [Penicillium riverlandense]
MLRPTQILCDRLDELSKTTQTVDMKYFFAAVSIDIMTGYCFAHEPQNVLKSDFGKKEKDDVDRFLEISAWNYHIPWILYFIYSLPEMVIRALAPAMTNILDLRVALSKQIEAIRSGQDDSYKHAKHRTIFHDLLQSKLPPKELETDRLKDEAFILVGAGADSTANTIRAIAYHVCANPPIRERLYGELKAAIPSPRLEEFPSIARLEQLPYLSAVIKEGLRLCPPIIHRLGRSFPEKDLLCHDYIIPAGTHVSMTAVLTHLDENIFHDSNTFRPERWLEGNHQLEQYLMPFSGGVRGCLGINLARAELFLILAAVFRQFSFDISELNRARDIDLTRDFILGAPSADSPGTPIKVLKMPI